MDFSGSSVQAFKTALNLSREDECIIYLVHVIDHLLAHEPVFASSTDSIDYTPQQILERMRGLVPQDRKNVPQIETAILHGSAASALSDFAKEKGADVIVVGTHGRAGLSRTFLGSTSAGLVRKAPCPVLVVKMKPEEAEKGGTSK